MQIDNGQIPLSSDIFPAFLISLTHWIRRVSILGREMIVQSPVLSAIQYICTSAICPESFRISTSIILTQSFARHFPLEMGRRAFLSRRIVLKGIRICSHDVTLYIIYGFKHRYIVTMELRKETLIMKMSALSFWLLRFRIYY